MQFRRIRVLIHIILATLAAVFAEAAPRRKVIIDQDAFGPGGSNMQSILLVIQSPDVEVLGITIESGDGWCAENVAHTLRLLEIIGRPDIPVLAGATFPLVNTAEETRRWEARYGKLVYKGAWMDAPPPGGNVKRPAPHAAAVVPALEEGAPQHAESPEAAANFLVRKVREFPGEVTILALGPMTNLALAARLDDQFAGLARELVFMGGSYDPRPANNEFALEYIYTPRLEFNFRWDPEATRAVLRSAWKKITQVPVDPTTKTLFTPDLAKRATRAGTPLTKYIAQYAQAFPLWDELAAAVWLEPGIVTRRDALAVDIDTDPGAGYGNTLCWPVGGGPGLGEREVSVVLEVDVAKLENLLIERFNAPVPPR